MGEAFLTRKAAFGGSAYNYYTDATSARSVTIRADFNACYIMCSQGTNSTCYGSLHLYKKEDNSITLLSKTGSGYPIPTTNGTTITIPSFGNAYGFTTLIWFNQ